MDRWKKAAQDAESKSKAVMEESKKKVEDLERAVAEAREAKDAKVRMEGRGAFFFGEDWSLLF